MSELDFVFKELDRVEHEIKENTSRREELLGSIETIRFYIDRMLWNEKYGGER